MTETRLNRRKILLAGAAFPFAPALLKARPAAAAAPLQGPASAQFRRVTLGSFEVTTLLSGTFAVEKPQEIFGLNASPEEFAAASTAAFIPADRLQFFFTPTLVNTGTELVLFDTGLGAPQMTAALATAGITPDQIDVVVITHMHPDHIGGLVGETGPTFANARYVTGAVENNFWSGAGDEGYEKAVRPLAEKTTFVDAGGTVASGITGLAAFGHTPGHMIWMLDSAGKQLAITADTANHYVWSLAHPDWEVLYDNDKPAAAATRRAVFGMIAADRIPFIGYHMPFPGIGYVETAGDGFRYIPESYQMML